jgi:diaminopimelate epimerase
MSQTIHFSKMHGLGNDFVVIDGINQSIHLSKMPINVLSNRNMGIGFDQLLLVEKSQSADFACRIINSDGSEAEQCGNGMRCVARFVREENLTKKNSLTIETKSGVVEVTIKDYSNIQVTMNAPCFQPEKIPFIAEKIKKIYEFNLDSMQLQLAVLSVGNPHAILQVSSAATFPITEIAQKLAAHKAFPNGVNIGFMEILDRQHILLRTFERGVGETMACGSNACAAVVAGIHNGWLDNRVEVKPIDESALSVGILVIEWKGEGFPLTMTGPAEKVFSGTFELS